jgi:hypothetical protein
MVNVAVGAGVGEREAVDVAQAASSGTSSMSVASKGSVPRVFSVFIG